jgi:3-dehydroquinate synthase
MDLSDIKTYPSKSELQEFLMKNNFSSLFFIVDHKVSETHPHCLTELITDCPVFSYKIKGGENGKNIKSVTAIWKEMLKDNIDKDALIVNLGGGKICDIGGFVAATYKRGVRFVNIPTTLLAMLDAAIGGKNGVNVGNIKNAVGTIQLPQRVFTDPYFLGTLPQREIMSGFGELIKYALIGDKLLWEELRELKKINCHAIQYEWITKAANYKKKIVEEDLFDERKRHILNFGHTIGHALESYCLIKKKRLSHGHAVALGICCEAWLSYLHNYITQEDAVDIKEYIIHHFDIPELDYDDFASIYELCKNDKKNSGKLINVSLLSTIGKGIPDQQTNEEEIKESLAFLFI